MSRVLPAAGVVFDAAISVAVVGGGAAGACAALAAAKAGAEVVILERDALPRGSTALSAGLVPAAGTRFQLACGITDDADGFAADIQRKAGGAADPAIVAMVTRQAGPTIEWLADRHGLPFSVVDDFDYPGHGARRMHGLPSRSGAELIDRLQRAVEAAGVPVVTGATVDVLYADPDGRIRGIGYGRPDGTRETLATDAVVLACNGYGGDPALVRQHIPEMDGALYFGHPGNRGDAVRWGEALGASLRFMSGYQGHGSVAQPHGILITWAVIMEGGVQVDAAGRRFSDETHGYSEQAAVVLREAFGVAFDIFDARIAGIARQFEDFRTAEASGAVVTAADVEGLAAALHLPEAALRETLDAVASMKTEGRTDRFGRRFAGAPALVPPYCGVRVTGALFHTQGGLAVDTDARVLRADGSRLPNLFAAGGAAAGVSGPTAAGYLSGNGLLTATVLGRTAGAAAAKNLPQGEAAQG